MRVDVSKCVFIGASRDQEAFLQKIQEFGYVEFIHPHKKKLPVISKEAERFSLAIKCLRGYVITKEQEKTYDIDLANSVCHEVIQLKQERESIEHKLEELEKEVDRIFPFGCFSFASIHAIEADTQRTFRFFYAKASKALATKIDDLILVHSTEGIDYFIALTHQEILHPDLIEVQIPDELSELQKEYQTLEQRLHPLDEELKELTKYNWLLHYAFYKKMDSATRNFVSQATDKRLDDTLFSIQGWVPKNKLQQLNSVCQNANIFIDEVRTEKQEQPPTYLENRRLARVGEDLVHIFDTPSPADKDPSLWLLFSFSLFFAMIVGDAGYGLIFLLTACVLHRKYKPKKEFARRFMQLTFTLSISCVLWGFLTHSFFGIPLSSSNWFYKHSLINYLVEQKAAYHLHLKDATFEEWATKDPQLRTATTAEQFLHMNPNLPISAKFADTISMELALLVGSCHLIIGMLRYLRIHKVGIGWIFFIIGAYLYIPTYLGAVSLIHFSFGVDYAQGASFGLQLLFGGLACATLIAMWTRGIMGIFEIMNSVQIFSDVLSYLRIYALGLAGAIMSTTINEMSGKLPLLLAIIVVLLAHGVNVILSIMGGTIHGLRLNFLEWYHYSFEGGGKRFTPLAIHLFE